MEISIPKELRDLETRVGLTPTAVQSLISDGHTLYVQSNAGLAAGFPDPLYEQVGAQIVYSTAEAYGRAELVVKITRPTAAEHQFFRPQQTILAFFHLTVASHDLLADLTNKEITALAYETMCDEHGRFPALWPMSEAVGRLAPIIAGQLLTSAYHGRGILLNGLPGVPPAVVVILGAGVLGEAAARAFLGLGAQIIILDKDIKKLKRVDELLQGRATTMVANQYNIKRAALFADVLVGAVYQLGERAPILIPEEIVSQMRSGTVIIDFAIDQGGCIATSRPTTIRDPIFTLHDVIHFCVPNATALIPRTSSYAISNTALPFIRTLANKGIKSAIIQDPIIQTAVNLYRGILTHKKIAQSLGKEATDLINLLEGASA